MNPPRALETSRLRLRPPEMSDAATIFERYTRDPEVTRYLTWRPHETVDAARVFLRRCAAAWETGERLPWVLTLQKGDEGVIGMVDLRIGSHRAEVGHFLARPYWNGGT